MKVAAVTNRTPVTKHVRVVFIGFSLWAISRGGG